ncbi:hypothetical protein GCM10017783_16330 [Deinococcus piscis]|uniref:Uncharacterized protein n=1 Tax=Deinococcus piscis TaxID=394230 RepID=A0ABQ3KCC9_9DEIO|nr:hypothetical protein GCM10017783_16330 [Deinococcus piscis]
MQTNADQASTLEAQYVAESNMNYARSVLGDLQAIMDKRPGGSAYIKVPPNISLVTVRQDAANYCDNGAFSTSLPSYVQQELPPGLITTPTWCTLQPTTTGTGAAGVLAKYVTPEAYTDNLTSSEAASAQADPAAFWRDIFTNPQNRLARANAASFRLQPLGVLNMGNRYRFYVGVGDMASKGEAAGATRVLTARNNVAQGVWWFELGTGNLLNSVLHTDHHRAKSGATNSVPQINFVNQRFYGSVHTNESFLFQSGARTQFIGSGKRDRNGNPIEYKVTSAGCDNLPGLGVTAPDNFECTKSPKYYANVGGYPTIRRGTNTQLRTRLDGETDLQFDLNGDGVLEANAIDFSANYIALPTNSANQRAAAEGRGVDNNPLPDGSRGLNLTAAVNNLALYAGDAAGNPLATFSGGKWNEPSPTFQYINVESCTSGGWREVSREEYNSTPSEYRTTTSTWSGTRYFSSLTCATTQYRVDKDGSMAVKQNGSWIPNGKFNGVIYGNQINSVQGPQRRHNPTLGREDLAAAPPALASFSGITIAAERDINVLNDLTMSDPPCRMEVSTCSNAGKGKNMLGIYSQQGDIKISSTAPTDLMIHSALMTSLGEVGVTNYNQGNPKGDVHLRGALVESWYGAFGTVNGNTPMTGYGRDFTYDERYRDGIKPPFWPESPKWETETPNKGTRGLANLVITNQEAAKFR